MSERISTSRGTSSGDSVRIALRGGKIPWVMKVGFTAFMLVLVPYYWLEYGPTNFLYFCDVALFLALLAVWSERSFYASMAAVGITVPQLLWQVDFLGRLAGIQLTGMTAYMFDDGISLFARSLSFFHFWLPIMLWYVVWKLGYDGRAMVGWTLTAWGLLLICFFLMPPAGATLEFPNQPHNINYVYGPDDARPQPWMPSTAWLALLFIGLPSLIYWPTHRCLSWAFANGADSRQRWNDSWTAIGSSTLRS